MPEKQQPLAVRMRPRILSEIVGQTELLNPDGLLYKMIANDVLTSIILYGPPGTGKTTIAQVIAGMTSSDFEQLNAVAAGKKDIETVCLKAKKLLEQSGQKTILFIDEIHRFNKAQQDYLLPFVESGLITMIGATTENPYFEVNAALVSRSKIFQLKPVTAKDIETVLFRALTNIESGLGGQNLEIEPAAAAMIAEQANGDVRHALSSLELASFIAKNNKITLDNVKTVIQRPHLQYDKDGDKHYDTISAFIKSMRGSDPDAVLYWLARMLEAGEDPKYIARRIIIAASEDVSNADPMALPVAVNASLAVERIGMPEGRIILAQAALYITMAPKSNSAVKGISAAAEYIKRHPSNEVPAHLCDCHYESATELGHGIGYDYPHDHPSHWCEQKYLPDSVLKDLQTQYFYHNSHIGFEAEQADYQNKIRKGT